MPYNICECVSCTPAVGESDKAMGRRVSFLASKF